MTTEIITSPKRNDTVLICEDERDLLDLYSAVLSQDFKIVKAASAEECITKFLEIRKSMPQNTVVLLDFKLGEMKGDELARKLARLGRAKILLMSALELDANLIKKLKDDNIITEFLIKPIKISTLKQEISSCFISMNK